jgi:hypothetical protein
MLVEIYKFHNHQFASLVGTEFAPGTLKKFKTALSSLEAFVTWKFSKADIAINALNYQFITDYEFYLKTVPGLQHNSAVGIIKKLKKIGRQCVANDWIMQDPFMNYKIKTHGTQRAFLLEDELKIIAEKCIQIERLSQVRDIFFFRLFHRAFLQ